jgi:hypothetical protein
MGLVGRLCQTPVPAFHRNALQSCASRKKWKLCSRVLKSIILGARE